MKFNKRIVINCHTVKEAKFMTKWVVRGLIKFRNKRGKS